MQPTVVLLHADAPRKPAEGAACNGCGLCCAWEPCPLGMLLSRRRRGECRALRWDAALRVYRCGVLDAPHALWPWMPVPLLRLVRRFAARWIAAGAGCDCSAEPAH